MINGLTIKKMVEDSIRHKSSYTLLSSIIAIGIALFLGILFGRLDPTRYLIVLAAIIITIVVVLQQNELAAVLVVAVNLYLDWFVGLLVASQLLAFLLLFKFFLSRSPQHPWGAPRALWLWFLFMFFAIFPAIQGFTGLWDFAFYYPNMVSGALLMFWLGTVVAKDIQSVRRFFKILAAFGTLIAMHAIIQTLTGKLLFATSSAEIYLASKGYYQLFANSTIYRAGSFFVQPDAGSAFLAMMLFLPAGLLVESTSLLKRMFYLIEIILIAIALLFTYSTGAWLAAGMGLVCFVLLIGSLRLSIQIILCTVVAVILMLLIFPAQLGQLMQHASNPLDLSLRQGLWETAWNIIQAHPWTGIGLSRTTYLQVEEAYRVVLQYIPENNPHNSYLELGAMAGLPVLGAFLALLAFALWQALSNWRKVDTRTRVLFGAGIASIIALSFNSWSFGLWTIPPLAVPGWLLLGVIASSLFAKSVTRSKANQKNPASNGGQFPDG